MIEHHDTFALLAELSLGLLGFAGVAASFGGRERAYGTADRHRLGTLFFGSSMVLASCVATLTMDAAHVPARTVFVVVSAVCLVGMGFAVLVRLPMNYRLARDPSASVEPWAAYVASIVCAVMVLLLGGNLWLGGEAWPLLAADSIALLFCVWVFTRLLMRAS